MPSSSNLPPSRQTLLFSATQSSSVSDLARLSLTDYKNVGDSISTMNKAVQGLATPSTLQQSYITVRLPDKLDILFSFIKSHLKAKILVFLSSSKQVHFVYETLRRMQPGISLMYLHGRQKQKARTETLDKFSRAQQVCLFATDVVARGIDFPAIDWVIQVDCPEDVDTYIHRVGRSARYGKKGRSLIMLTPQESDAFLRRLKARKIEPEKLTIKQSKMRSIKPQLQSLLFKDPELKYLGQKAFVSYVRSIYIQKDKEVFKFEELETEEFAKSLGLPGAPKIKIKGMKAIERAKEAKNTSRQLLSLSKADEDGEIRDEEEEAKKKKKVRTKYDKMFERKNQTVLSEHYMNITAGAEDGAEDEEDFMTVKRRDHDLNEAELPDLVAPTSKRAQKRALSKKASLSTKGNATKLVFDDEGVSHPVYELEGEEEFHKAGDAELQKQKFLEREKEYMSTADTIDKQLAKEKKQERKRRRAELLRRELEAEYSDDDEENIETRVFLGTGNLSDDMEEMARDSESESESEPERDTRPQRKKQKKDSNYEEEAKKNADIGVTEFEQPEDLEDLESLTSRLIGS